MVEEAEVVEQEERSEVSEGATGTARDLSRKASVRLVESIAPLPSFPLDIRHMVPFDT